MGFDFYIVDVFAQTQFSGNPLAVVVNANELDKETKQAIAAEMNFSETCFLNAIESIQGGFDLQIYTPSQEIAFAGHPILGAAKVLVDQYYSGNEKSIKFNLQEAQVKIIIDDNDYSPGNIWFSSPEIAMGPIISKINIASILNVNVDIFNSNLPVQQISASTSALILPMANNNELQKFIFNSDVFEKLSENNLPNLLYCFTEETLEKANDYQVRFFFNSHGVREDPATGNGAAFFGAYLAEHIFHENSKIIKIEQGQNLGRPSLISIKLDRDQDKSYVRVGGNVVLNVKGEIVL